MRQRRRGKELPPGKEDWGLDSNDAAAPKRKTGLADELSKALSERAGVRMVYLQLDEPKSDMIFRLNCISALRRS